jgi:hypothetical protein
MKKTHLFAALLASGTALTGGTAIAQTLTAFTPGDVVVERVGNGSATLTSAGTAVFLDEYTLTGTLVGSYEMPTTGTPLVDSGTASSDGEISTSANGQYLVVPGYDAALGTAGIASSSSTAVPREVATLSGTGALVQTTFNNFTGQNIRSVASANGSTVYAVGGADGVVSVTSGSSGGTGTTVSSAPISNARAIADYEGQLLLSTSSGSTYRLATLGAVGMPSSTATELSGITSSNVTAPYQFVATTLTPGGTSIDTIYVADEGAGKIEKFSGSIMGGFTLTGTAALTDVTGLTGITTLVDGTEEEELVATTAAASATKLYTLFDTSGAGGTLSGTPTSIASAATDEAFLGVTFAPTIVPEPSTFALLIAGGVGGFLLARRRSLALNA